MGLAQRLVESSGVSVGVRRDRLRHATRTIAQAAIASMLAWWISNDLLGHQQAFFAPIVAITSLGVGLQRPTRRAVEIVGGVSVGVLVADLFISWVGVGTWQLGVTVALAMAAAVFFSGGVILVLQAGSTAVVVATLVPPTPDAPFAFERFLDAVIGGAVGLGVAMLLLPTNPVRQVDRALHGVVDPLAQVLRDTADALERGDDALALDALARARGLQVKVDQLRDASRHTADVALLAPARWGSRPALVAVEAAVPHLDNAARNGRVLARQAVTAIRRQDVPPPGLPAALRQTATAVTRLADMLGERWPDRARLAAAEAAEQATDVLHHTAGLFSQVVVAQARAVAADVLYATGLRYEEVVAFLPDVPEPRPTSRRDEVDDTD